MTDHSPESLSDIEILDILQSMKDDELDVEAKEMIRNGGKAGRQEAHKQALVALNASFETKFVEAVTLALGLNEGQAKKIRYKKDRVRILKVRGIDYLDIDGAETAQVLSQISQAIQREDAIVTKICITFSHSGKKAGQWFSSIMLILFWLKTFRFTIKRRLINYYLFMVVKSS